MFYNYTANEILHSHDPLIKGKNKSVFFFRSGKEIHKIKLEAIVYVLSFGNYCKFYLDSKQVLINMSLKEFESRFCKNNFIRIHKSYIIAVKKIDKVVDNIVYLNKESLPIGKLYRTSFFETILSNLM